MNQLSTAGWPPPPPQANAKRLVIFLGITQILAWGSTYYLPAVLAAIIARDTSWPLPYVIGGLSWGLLIAGVTAPWIGQRIDRYDGRQVLAASSLLLALGLALLSVVENLAGYYLAWTVLGLGMGAGLYDAAFAILGARLGSRARSAIAGLTLFAGFASTLAWPAVTGLEHELGWRSTCLVLAGLHALIGLPIHLLFAPLGGPPPRQLRPASTKPQRFGDSPGMLLIATIFTAHALVVSSLLVHLLDLLKDLGIAAAIALTIGMVFGPSQVAARLLDFWIGKRIHPVNSTRLGMALCSIAVCLLLFADTSMAFLAVAVYGAGNGMLTIARGALPLALFGSEGYGARMGWLARPMLVAQAIAPPSAAVALQTFGPRVTLAMLVFLSVCGLLGSGYLAVKRVMPAADARRTDSQRGD